MRPGFPRPFQQTESYEQLGTYFDVSQLAIATLGTTFAGAALAVGGKEKKKEQGPPINATSKDEEQFIQYAGSVDGIRVERPISVQY